MRYVNAKPDAGIYLGRQGENEVTTVLFDVSGWAEEYGAGSFRLLYKRSGDAGAYPVEVTVSGSEVQWLVSSADVGSAGQGCAQLVYTVNEAIARSEIFMTITGRSLDGSEDPPDPWESWVDQILEAAGEAANDAATAKRDAEDAEAWAAGTRNGVPVSEDDPAYQNNAKYLADNINRMTPITEAQIRALFV